MNKLKNIIVYSVIIVLCIAAFAGYLMTGGKAKVTPTASKEVTEEKKEATQPPKLDAAKQKHIDDIMKKAMEEPASNPVVGVGTGDDYGKVTAAAVENAGGLKDIIKKGNVVLIKPNICTITADAGSPYITDYRVVRELADMVRQLGASKVIIAEGSISGNAFSDFSKNNNKFGEIKD